MSEAAVQVEGGTVEVTDKTEQVLPVTQQNPLELHAQFFTLYWPKFCQLVMKLSNKQLRRVLMAVVEHPLNEKPFHFTTQEEKDAFNIGVQLAQSNALMQMVTLTSSPEFEKALDGSVPTSQDMNNQELNKE